MDVIQLAALPPETPVIAALQLMRARKQLGVICVKPNNHLFLAKAEDVGRAFGKKKSTLGEVKGLVPVSGKLIPIQPDTWLGHWSVTGDEGGLLIRRGGAVLTDAGDKGTLEHHFTQIRSDYVLSKLSVGEASIITRSEGIVRVLEGNPSRTHCSCNTDFHNFDLYVGMTCPKHMCPV